MVSTNVASEKSYAKCYDVAKRNLKLSARELDEIYALPYVQHFYAPKEIEGFKMRWQAASPVVSATAKRAA
jgi:hypothetical protein